MQTRHIGAAAVTQHCFLSGSLCSNVPPCQTYKHAMKQTNLFSPSHELDQPPLPQKRPNIPFDCQKQRVWAWTFPRHSRRKCLLKRLVLNDNKIDEVAQLTTFQPHQAWRPGVHLSWPVDADLPSSLGKVEIVEALEPQQKKNVPQEVRDV
eukprot:3832842-Amphidinium_carterae.1